MVKRGICFNRNDAIKWLLQRAVMDLVLNEYLPKLDKFKQSLKEL